MARIVLIAIFYLTSTEVLFSQIMPSVTLDKLVATSQLSEILEEVEDQTGYFISYNTNALNQNERIILDTDYSTWELDKLFSFIRDQTGYTYTIDTPNKKVVIYPRKHKYLTGVVRDSATLETLPGVAIYTSQNSGITNDEGYFSLRLANSDSIAYVSLLAYKTKAIKLNKDWKTSSVIQLIYDNRLPEIIIQVDSSSTDYKPEFNPEVINISDKFSAKGIGGRLDLVSQIKRLPGVSNGSEAQNGFTVRGGGPDQNLILLDGLPIYEVSHLGGLTSIFMDNTIKKAALYKCGIPARFGGKLSSVLDVRLNDGNRNEYKRQLSLGLENISGSIEGPIGEKTSFITSARNSLLNLYTRPLLKSHFNVINSDFSYNDIYTKVSHWFNPSNRLSASIYFGNDVTELARDNIRLVDRNFNELSNYSDDTKINWSNNLVALNWKTLISDKIYMHSQFGYASFNFNSKNQLLTDNVMTGMDTIAIQSSSCQSNLSGNVNLDIYTDSYGKIKTGIGLIQHESQPSIIERPIDLPDNACGDSLYRSEELYAFIENRLELSNNWNLNLGLRVNNFFGLGSSYFYIQPRFNLNYQNEKSQFNFGFSRMNQFLHLLVNPTSGLPSDVWVPSTDNLEPQQSNLLSIDYSRALNENLKITAGVFYNRYFNIIEYTDPAASFQGIVLDNQQVFFTNTTNVSWEQRITSGTGASQGLELEINYITDNFYLDIAYTFSKSERTIQNSNGLVETFRYKFDRPHDLAVSCTYSVRSNKYFNLSWVFGNGNRWTYPDISVGGNLQFTTRNNTELTNYHHLDISYTVEKEILRPKDLQLVFGIYNIYNNRNPFYAYPIIGENVPFGTAEQVSLYPIFPQITARFSW